MVGEKNGSVRKSENKVPKFQPIIFTKLGSVLIMFIFILLSFYPKPTGWFRGSCKRLAHLNQEKKTETIIN